MKLISSICSPGARWLRLLALLAVWVVPQATVYPLMENECDETPVESQEFVRTPRISHEVPTHTPDKTIVLFAPRTLPQFGYQMRQGMSGHFLANGLRAPLRC